MFISDSGGGTESTFSKFSAGLHARLGRSADILEATANIQSSRGKLQEWVSENLVVVNRGKCKVLHVGQAILIQCYRLRES